ncbi:cytidylate kinase family protein [Patescibacteria group bacterium]|nr:cytidylate kinase family protein [Patescibacteria group bacterium]
MDKNIITITGKPGCGKSTIAEMIAKKLNYKLISSGDIARQIAKEKGISEDVFFSKYIKKHPEIDYEIDDRVIEYCKNNNNIVVPTRMAGILLEKENIESFKVYMQGDFSVRVNRIAKRENKKIKIVEKETIKRRKSEVKRYKKLYKVDINNLSIYNFVIYTHFTQKSENKIQVFRNYFGEKDEDYIKINNTMPDNLSNIIIKEYKEYVRRKNNTKT